jgi:hypothetical protein
MTYNKDQIDNILSENSPDNNNENQIIEQPTKFIKRFNIKNNNKILKNCMKYIDELHESQESIEEELEWVYKGFNTLTKVMISKNGIINNNTNDINELKKNIDNISNKVQMEYVLNNIKNQVFEKVNKNLSLEVELLKMENIEKNNEITRLQFKTEVMRKQMILLNQRLEKLEK